MMKPAFFMEISEPGLGRSLHLQQRGVPVAEVAGPRARDRGVALRRLAAGHRGGLQSLRLVRGTRSLGPEQITKRGKGWDKVAVDLYKLCLKIIKIDISIWFCMSLHVYIHSTYVYIYIYRVYIYIYIYTHTHILLNEMRVLDV